MLKRLVVQRWSRNRSPKSPKVMLIPLWWPKANVLLLRGEWEVPLLDVAGFKKVINNNYKLYYYMPWIFGAIAPISLTGKFGHIGWERIIRHWQYIRKYKVTILLIKLISWLKTREHLRSKPMEINRYSLSPAWAVTYTVSFLNNVTPDLVRCGKRVFVCEWYGSGS